MNQLDLFEQEQGAEAERSMLDELLHNSRLYHTSPDLFGAHGRPASNP